MACICQKVAFFRNLLESPPRPKMGLSASSSRGLLPTNLPLFSCPLQLPISLRMDLLLTAGEPVLRRDVANGTVQADIVVMLDVALHQPPRILQRKRRSGPNALSFERFVPTFDFP